MGYTHYFSFNKNDKKIKAVELEKKYQTAIKDCHRVIRAYYKENKGTEASLSGYSAHTNLSQYGGLEVNGKGDNMHEDFYIREHYNQNKGGFCKTRQKPYDIVVVACLSILKFHLGDNFQVDSDGDFHDWIDGVNLANKVLKRSKNKILNPIPFNVNSDLKVC